MKLRLSLTEAQKAILTDCLDGQEIRVWAFRKIKEEAASFAVVAKEIELTGHKRIAAGKTVYASDLSLRVLTEGDGDIEVEVGPKLQKRIEWGLAFIEAASKVSDQPKPAWESPNEWVQLLIEEKAAQEAAKDDTEDIEDEEKALIKSKETEKK